jgi:hypothetical protein
MRKKGVSERIVVWVICMKGLNSVSDAVTTRW